MPRRDDPTQGAHDIENTPSPFVRMVGADADKNCGKVGGFYPDNCPVCHSRVILHCDDCKIQVTSCLCKMSGDLDAEVLAEANLALLPEGLRHKIEEEARMGRVRRFLEEHGLWLPGRHHG